MEIIHVISGKINDENRHQINRIVEKMSCAQHQNGATVSIWCIDYFNKPSFFENRTKFLEFKQSCNILSLTKSLKQEIKLNRLNSVFHFHGSLIFDYFLISKYLTKLNIGYAFTPHSISENRQPNVFEIKTYIQLNVFDNKLIDRALSVQCTESSEFNFISRKFPFAKTKLIPLGNKNNHAKFTFSPLKKRNTLTFGYFSKFDNYEAIEILLSSFKRYRSKLNGQAELWVITEQQYYENYKVIATAMCINKYVKIHIPNHKEVRQNIIANFDVLYSIYQELSDPSIILKAASMGIPAVLSNNSLISSNVTKYKAGYVLKRNKATNIATSMKRMEEHFLTNSLGKLGENAIRMINQAYDWNQIANEMESIYK